ncbi:TolC family protein [Sphingomonas sp. MMS24-JH45]
MRDPRLAPRRRPQGGERPRAHRGIGAGRDGMVEAAGDPQLDRLVADALAGSPSLDAAAARVRQAQAQLSRADANRGPDVALDAQVQAARLSGRYTIPPPFGGTVRELGTAQAGLNWDLDLFGRQKAAIAQAAAGADAARFDVAAARLMLAGAVTQSYAELARAERQTAVAQRAIATRRQSLGLVDVQGRATASPAGSTARRRGRWWRRRSWRWCRRRRRGRSPPTRSRRWRVAAPITRAASARRGCPPTSRCRCRRPSPPTSSPAAPTWRRRVRGSRRRRRGGRSRAAPSTPTST